MSKSKKKPESSRAARTTSRARGRVSKRAKSPGDGALSRDEIESIKKALLAKREELLRQQKAQLSSLQNEDRYHLADLEEMAPEASDTDSVCELVDLSSGTISEIDLALEKIQQGSYGYCDVCGRPIARERLEVLPFASLCVGCQREKETKRALGHDEG